MSSVIERRLLVNYRVDPTVAASLLPTPLRPQLVNGWAVAGICLIRLGRLRPGWIPGWAGMRTENAAHRVAVEWDAMGGRQSGVYIPRRDSNSAVTVLAGGRLFPGEHHRAYFDVRETPRDLRRLDGLELRADRWVVEPAEVISVRSSFFFDDAWLFPAGSAAIDCALLMRDIPVTWNAL